MKALIWLAFVVALFYGWVANVYLFCKLDFNTPVQAEVFRGAGIFIPPLGVVLGYVSFNEERS